MQSEAGSIQYPKLMKILSIQSEQSNVNQRIDFSNEDSVTSFQAIFEKNSKQFDQVNLKVKNVTLKSLESESDENKQLF